MSTLQPSLARKTASWLLRWIDKWPKCPSTVSSQSDGSACEVQRLHLIWMSWDSWASCPVLPWDCRNAKWSGLRISFPSSSFLLPLFLLPPGDTASWREGGGRRGGEGCVYVCVRMSEEVQIVTETKNFPTSQQYKSSDYSFVIALAASRAKSLLFQFVGLLVQVCVSRRLARLPC